MTTTYVFTPDLRICLALRRHDTNTGALGDGVFSPTESRVLHGLDHTDGGGRCETKRLSQAS